MLGVLNLVILRPCAACGEGRSGTERETTVIVDEVRVVRVADHKGGPIAGGEIC